MIVALGRLPWSKLDRFSRRLLDYFQGTQSVSHLAPTQQTLPRGPKWSAVRALCRRTWRAKAPPRDTAHRRLIARPPKNLTMTLRFLPELGRTGVCVNRTERFHRGSWRRWRRFSCRRRWVEDLRSASAQWSTIPEPVLTMARRHAPRAASIFASRHRACPEHQTAFRPAS